MSRDRMQRQRFEQKYMLDEEQARIIREFIATHLELDENGVGKPNFSYPVHSLYLDSPELYTFWTTINGDKNRYKLRLRFYNDRPDSPVFFEIKRRMNNCILKQRGGVHKQAVERLLRGQLPDTERIGDRALALPLRGGLDDDAVAWIVKALKDSATNVGAGAAIYL